MASSSGRSGGASGGSGKPSAPNGGRSDPGSARSRKQGAGRTRRGALGDARAYSPRGRSLRDQTPLQVVPPPPPPADTRIPRARTAGRPMRKPAIRVRALPVLKMPNANRRLRLATGLALLMFAVVAVRLVELQFEGAPAAAAEGLDERLKHETLFASRGSILDRNGDILAHSVAARMVYADPTEVKDPAATAQKLAPLLGQPVSKLLPLVSPHHQPNSTIPQSYEVLASGVKIETGDVIEALDLPGIEVRRAERRDVLSKDVAANIIGFTGEDLGGLVGLEARFDDLLAGKNGVRTFETGRGDNLDKEIPGGYHKTIPARPGSSLQLTIDRDLQYEVQRILTTKMQAVKAVFGSATVLDVKTGEVLAQASWPTYDADNPLASKPSDRGDAASNELVDPGSVHKAIVLAAALEEGKITPDSTVTIAPTITVADKTYSDTHPFPSGTRLTLPGVMAFSSNVATIKIAHQLGPENLYKYQRLFGLGEPTGISIPGEASGSVRPPDEWQGSDYGSIPIGNGVSVTPLQMTAAYAAIANDGVWVQPHLIEKIIGPDGKAAPAPEVPSHRVISTEHAAQLRQILEAVTTVNGATGRSAAIPGYRIAGKTGTGRYYANGHYGQGEVASFVGMAPADAPRYAIGVFAYTPGGNGGVICGPAFKEMMSFTLKHFRVPPTGVKAPTFVLQR